MRPLKTLIAGLAACVAISSGAQAFPDKPIDFLIFYSPGGGNDTVVRMVAPFMEKHLPGDAQVVPQNMPGAGGQRGATALYRADPDGYSIGLYPMPGLALPQLLGETEFDLREMTWLGRIEASGFALLVPGDSDIMTLEDFMDGREITITATGFGSTGLAAAQLAAAALDVEATFITGYPSATEGLVGVIRGDGNASMAVIETAAGYVESGDLRALAISSPTPLMPDVPTFGDLGYPELNVLSIDRWVAGPPNMDPEIAAMLEAALRNSVQDPEFVAQAEESGRTLAYLNGQQVADLLSESFAFYEQYKEFLGNPAEK